MLRRVEREEKGERRLCGKPSHDFGPSVAEVQFRLRLLETFLPIPLRVSAPCEQAQQTTSGFDVRLRQEDSSGGLRLVLLAVAHVARALRQSGSFIKSNE